MQEMRVYLPHRQASVQMSGLRRHGMGKFLNDKKGDLKMGDKKMLNENDIMQVNGGMVAGLEEISGGEQENERYRKEDDR